MNRAFSPRQAFTLVEVAAALGIAAFALVALFGLFPLGLKENASSALETRGSHLAQTLFATLAAGPFDGVACFGLALDLASLDAGDGPVSLYAAFPPTGEPEINPSPGAADYRLELRFAKMKSDSGRVTGSRVTLTVEPLRPPFQTLRFQSIIGNF